MANCEEFIEPIVCTATNNASNKTKKGHWSTYVQWPGLVKAKVQGRQGGSRKVVQPYTWHPLCYRFEVWAFSFSPRHLSSLSCINGYLALDGGGNVSD